MSDTSCKMKGVDSHQVQQPVYKKSRNLKPTGKAYLQVFGTGSGDTSPAVYLFCDSQRYIFNCGESTQRLFHENKLKLGKINNLFLTQISWDMIGGLPGLLLTLRDAGKTALGLHGPVGLSHFLNLTKPFVSIQHLGLKYTDYTGINDEQYTDENITVTPVYIKGQVTENSYNSDIVEIQDLDYEIDNSVTLEQLPNLDNDKNIKQKRCDLKDQVPNPLKRCRFDIHPKPVVNYICKLTRTPPKIKIDKAINLGVPKGPMLGQLQNGQSVTLADGSMVKPEDILEQTTEGCVFCIIDCPSKHYFDNLIINEELVMYEIGKSNIQPSIMIHLSPAIIVNMPEYLEWTKRFGSSCQHLFLNSEMSVPKAAMLSQLRIQYKLHQLDKDIFPRLFTTDIPKMIINDTVKQNWKAAESFLIYHLRSTQKLGYDYTDIKTKWGRLMDETSNNKGEGFVDESNRVEDFINPDKFLCRKIENINTEIREKTTEEPELTTGLKNKDENFEIVFLGTGASLPSKYRNVSSTLVNISKEKVMLLDCGEGTYGQLYRHYGPDLTKILLKICCVFISHIHADHHLGLLRILKAWQKYTSALPDIGRPDPILVVGPPSLYDWLKSYGTFYESLHLRFLDSVKCQNENFIGSQILSTLLESEKVTIVPVVHCYQAFGLVLTHKNGWKLVYSGDTRPCNELVKEGLDATVLIHEATFEENLHAEAIAKYHCTTMEAIECGQEMKAEFILLNHFSQRYPKIPVFNKKYHDWAGIAFDHMKVNFKNIPRVSKLLEPLQEIFKDEIKQEES